MIGKVLSELPKDVTLVYTTHRKSWLGFANRVLLLENGQIKGDVPPEKLMAAGSGENIANPAGGKTAAGLTVNVGGQS